MESHTSVRSYLKIFVLYVCTATISECTPTLGTKMLYSGPEASVTVANKPFRIKGTDAISHQQLEPTESQQDNYSSCGQFFQKAICNECFPENGGTSRGGTPLHSTHILRNNLNFSVSTNELTRISSLLITKLREGTCAWQQSPPSRVRRTVAVGDAKPFMFLQAVYSKYGKSGVISEDQFGILLEDLGIGKLLQTNHSNSSGDHSVIQRCFLATELIDIFNTSGGIPMENFASVCPSLIQQITQGCVIPVTPPTELDLKMYGWATLAVASITVLSMLAMVAVPTHGSRFYAAVMQFFVALAVSSLSGDALLHLLPEALGIHDIQKTEDQPNHTFIILTVILAVYFFFIFERVMSLCLKEKPYGHGHVHSRPRRETFVDENSCDMHADAMMAVAMENQDDKKTNETDDGQQDDKEVEEEISTEKKMDKEEEVSKVQKPQPRIFGLNMLSIMVLIGDAVHNVTDGITIGVSFVKGPFVGASTTIAVFFHEVPHEVGDFAVMLRNGVSFRKAMVCSLLSNLAGFAGLYAGLLLGSENVVQRWIFAATAGMFLYIALVSLVPEMNQQAEEADHKPWRVFLRHNIGLLLGWAIMLALGVFE